jgi:hypothetical protein
VSSENATSTGRAAALRLRIGIGMFVLSWMPFPQLYISLHHLQGSAADEARLIGWAIEWTVGILGLLLAGSAAKIAVSRVGWRHLPKALWHMLRTGQVPPAPAQPQPAEPDAR